MDNEIYWIDKQKIDRYMQQTIDKCKDRQLDNDLYWIDKQKIDRYIQINCRQM